MPPKNRSFQLALASTLMLVCKRFAWRSVIRWLPRFPGAPLLGLVLILVFAGRARARPKTDVIVMKNGDRYTCEIVSLSQGQLKVKTVNTTGAVLLDWTKVNRIDSKIGRASCRE